MTKRRLIPLHLIILSVMLCVQAYAAQAPKNVIYMIGDGMGVSQVVLARLTLGKPLNMDSIPHTAFIKTYSANSAVTDSAAAATALSSGFKTNNGMIATLPDGTKVQTILEAAAKTGKATGLVTTVTITHATPAGFGAHVKSRASEADIAPQYLEKKIDVLMGGGKQFFMPKSQTGSKRADERDLLAEAKAAGYSVVESRDDLLSAKGTKVLGLFHMAAMNTELPEPSIAEMADKAISVLSTDKDGFFVMIEGGQIDYKCHANDGPAAAKQAMDFDVAVGKALEFAKKRGDTLVVVTADHETGGLSLLGSEEGGDKIEPTFATKSHSACNVPLFAFGPGSEVFDGVMDNTDIPKTIAKIWGIKGFAGQK